MPVVELSKEQACGRSPAGIAGSNSAGGLYVLCCVLSVKIKGKLQDNQDKEASTDELHTKYTRI